MMANQYRFIHIMWFENITLANKKKAVAKSGHLSSGGKKPISTNMYW